jgi:hypothetical protein
VQQVLSASRPELIEVFTGLSPRAFRRLVAQVERRGGKLVADGIKGRQWSLPLADRVLLVATYYRTLWTVSVACARQRVCLPPPSLRPCW